MNGRRKYLQTLASATPVLPDVDSMTVVCPGTTRPSRMAARSIDAAARSFELPMGLNISSFAKTAAEASGPKNRLRRTRGVFPMAERIPPAAGCGATLSLRRCGWTVSVTAALINRHLERRTRGPGSDGHKE